MYQILFTVICAFQGNRKMRLGCADIVLHKKEVKAAKRRTAYMRYAEKQQANDATCSEVVNIDDVISDESEDSLDDVDDSQDPSYIATLCPDTEDVMIQLSLPKKTLLTETADVATRCGISHRQEIALTSKILKVGGATLEGTSISVSTSHRQRRQAVEMKSEKLKQDFIAHMPKYLVLHWDGKVIKYAQRRETDDRLAIIVSAPGNDPPLADQFLAAPCIPDSTEYSP